MTIFSKPIRSLLLLPLCVAAAAGCQGLNNTGNGALLGTGIGAVAGAIIGHQTGNRDKGALIGAATGALAGGLLGNAKDAREERDATIAEAQAVEEARQADLRAMTDYDLINMALSGISDEVIISTVQTRGGRFDLSPDGIINLKTNGVSDRVVLAIQKQGRPDATAVPAASSSRTSITVTRSPHYVVVHPHGHVTVRHPRRRLFHRRHW